MGFSSKKTTTHSTTTPTNPSWVEPQLNTLAGRITDLSKMDPYSFVAGPNGLQNQAYATAGGLAPDNASYDSAKGLFQGTIAGGASYDPATVHPNSILPNLAAYMSPYTQQVVDTSLADYDFGAGQTRAQNQLALANDETFGGSGGAIQTALSNDAINRGRGTLSAQLHDQGFQTGSNLANLDADRRQQAQLANMAAFNQARQFNATQRQTAGRDLVDAANAQNQTAVTDINTQSAIGDILRQIAQQQAAAPLSSLSTLAGSYGSLPLSLLHGEVTDSKTKTSPNLLAEAQKAAMQAAMMMLKG
jgi:hypothetical protein